VLQPKDLRLYLSLLLPVFSTPSNKPVISTEAAHSFIVGRAVEKSASPPHLFSVRNPHCSCCCLFFSTPKTVISTEAAHGLTVSRAVEKSAFRVDRRIHSNERPPPGRPSPPKCHDFVNGKLVKTPVSWSSQT